MNRSILALSASLALISSNLVAKEVVLKPLNQNLETQACFVAANESISAAKALIAQNEVNFNTFSERLTCNGMRIERFANKYGKQEQAGGITALPKKVALVAENSDSASHLCIDALTIGENAARTKHQIFGPVMCNGKNLPRFINSYQNRDVEIRNSAE